LLKILKLLLSENGFRWTVLFIISEVLVAFSEWTKFLYKILRKRMDILEKELGIPGRNSVGVNRLAWQTYNWHKKGEEWTFSQEWKQSLIQNVLRKYVKQNSIILEVGPGAGRWSEYLQKMSKELILVDLSSACIELCQQRFRNEKNISYFVNEGSNLDFISNDRIEFIWSFDVFVHIRPADIQEYMAEFHRVLVKGGVGIIHHAKEGGIAGGWRSEMTAKIFEDLCDKQGLKLIDQFDSWGHNNEYEVPKGVVSVFQK